MSYLTIDESKEFTQVTGLLPGQESLSILPVPESETLLSGDTTEVDDKTTEAKLAESTLNAK